MCNSISMQIFYCLAYLAENFSCILLGNRPSLANMLEELLAFDQLHENVELRVLFNTLIDSDNVGVVQAPVDFDFLPQSFDFLLMRTADVDNFGGQFEFGKFLNSLVYLGISSLSELLT